MGTTVPLGKSEGQRLEFKSAAALRNPFSISREIVAMLNAGGGVLWIGIREDGGIAVAVDGIAGVEVERARLLDHLIEAVEPRLQPDEVVIDTVEHQGTALLKLTVRPSGRGPYAQLKQGGHHFVTRIDHRVRPLTREEIFSLGAAESKAASPTDLSRLRASVLEREEAGLWIGLEPAPPMRLDIQDQRLERYLLDPAQTGNRKAGWSFQYPAGYGVRPKMSQRRLEFGEKRLRRTAVWENGSIEFWSPMTGLHHGTDARKEIYPLALLEYSVSIARFAARVFNETGGEAPKVIFVDGALVDVDDWHLPAYPPGTYGYGDSMHGKPGALEEDTFVLASPLRFSWTAFRERPDHAGYMLVRSIYQAFGLPDDRIPAAYDRIERRLVLPD